MHIESGLYTQNAEYSGDVGSSGWENIAVIHCQCNVIIVCLCVALYIQWSSLLFFTWSILLLFLDCWDQSHHVIMLWIVWYVESALKLEIELSSMPFLD